MRFLAIIAVKPKELFHISSSQPKDLLHISSSHLKELFRNNWRNTTFVRLPIYEKRSTFAGTNRI